MKGEEVHNDFPDRNKGFTARNRIKGGPTDHGSDHVMGARGSTHEKANGDAMVGSYGPAEIDRLANVDLQNELRDAGTAPKTSGGPFDPTMLSEREKFLSSSQAGNDAKMNSNQQGPDGAHGNMPGVGSQVGPTISGV